MKSTFFWNCLLLLTLSFGCKKYSANNLPKEQIHFGEGGGITGAITEYCLLPNGQLFYKKHFTDTLQTFKKIKKKSAKRIFSSCQQVQLDQIKLNNPGDKYYFLTYETAENKHRVTWGGSQHKPPLEIVELYASLKALTKEQ